MLASLNKVAKKERKECACFEIPNQAPRGFRGLVKKPFDGISWNRYARKRMASNP